MSHKNSQSVVNWDQARDHARAVSVGKNKKQTTNLYSSRCSCCGHLIQKQELPLCQNIKQLQFMGAGFPLYFLFLKYCIIFLVLDTLSQCIMSLSWALDENQDFCINKVPKTVPGVDHEVQCLSQFLYLSRISQHLNNNEIILRSISFFINLIFFIYMRNRLGKFISYLDQRLTTFSDYSLILKGLPKKNNIKTDLITLFQHFHLHSVVVLSQFENITEMEEKIHASKKVIRKISRQIQKSNPSNKNYSSLVKKHESLQTSLESMEQAFLEIIQHERNLYQKDEIYPLKAIICVESDEKKEQILKKYHNSGFLHLPEGWSDQDINNLKICQSPEPKELIWQNLNISQEKRYRNYIFGWLATILVLAFVSTIFYLLLSQLSIFISVKSMDNIQIAYFIFYSVLITIILINKFVFASLFHFICHYQKYSTKSKEEFGFTLKYLLGMFFTTALMTLLVDDVKNRNIYSEQFNIIQSEHLMIILNAFFIPLIWLVNPWSIVIKLKQKYYENSTYVTQQQANSIMENMEYQIGKRYAEIVKLIWLISLYKSLIPVGSMIALIGLICYYWIDKYNLLRRSTVKESVSGHLTLKIMTLLEFSIVLKPLGELIFDLQIRYQYSSLSIVFVIIGLIYILLPMSKIINCLNFQKFNHEEKLLQESIATLGDSYEALHPIMGQKMSTFLQELVQQINNKQQNSVNEQFINLNNIQKSILQQIYTSHYVQPQSHDRTSLKENRVRFLMSSRINQQMKHF